MDNEDEQKPDRGPGRERYFEKEWQLHEEIERKILQLCSIIYTLITKISQLVLKEIFEIHFELYQF